MATEQTTAPTDLKALLEIIADQNAKLEAKDKRIAFLESILNERVPKTVQKRYDEMKSSFDAMRDKIMTVFLENAEYSTTHGYTHEELIEEFRKKYPAIPTTNVPRRVRELVEKKLWAAPDPDSGKVVFRLKLDQKTEEKE